MWFKMNDRFGCPSLPLSVCVLVGVCNSGWSLHSGRNHRLLCLHGTPSVEEDGTGEAELALGTAEGTDRTLFNTTWEGFESSSDCHHFSTSLILYTVEPL